MSGGNYRRNPARDAEKFFIAIVGGWLGDRGQIIDLSDGHDPDFRIEYRDGRAAIGEIGLDVDEENAKMWAATFSHEPHQIIDLERGVGQWAVGLEVGASINALRLHLPRSIKVLAAAGISDLHIYGGWPRTPEADLLRKMRIRYVSRVSAPGPSRAMFFMPPIGGFIPTDANVISDWLEDSMQNRYPDSWQKLLVHAADERHVCFMAGSRTPFGVAERLRRLTEQMPSRPPELPAGITHVWATSRLGDAGTAMWSAATGWVYVANPPSLPLG